MERIPIKQRKSRKLPTKPSHTVLPLNDSSKQFYLGDISLGISNDVLPEVWTKCKIQFSDNCGNTSMQMEFDSQSKVVVVVTITNNFAFVEGLFTSAIFAMNFIKKEDNLFAQIFISRLPLMVFNKRIGNTIKTVIAATIGIPAEELDEIDETVAKQIVDTSKLYENVKMYQDRDINIPNVCIEHSSLKPMLRPYQEDTVRWMLLREKTPENTEVLHPLYQTLILKTGMVLYYNKYTGYIDNVKPVVPSLKTGGILADEMGLGKTIEVLACILSHPKPNESENMETETSNEIYNADLESNKENDAPTVCIQLRKPEMKPEDYYVDKPKRLKILNDWVKGSSKKSKTLTSSEIWYNNVLSGVLTENKAPENKVQCICGNTSMKDIVTFTLRRQPRYSAAGSPLARINWWRLCLDEVQTVEIPSSMISTMAKKLQAHHRWAVTGTPITKHISELYGLINYLQLNPYNEFETWKHLLYMPFLSGNEEPMLQFLAQVMRRNSKSDVMLQINIPNQTVKEHQLEFSAVEEYYYKKEYEMCISYFLFRLQKHDLNILVKELSVNNLKKLMLPIRTILNACTHPHITRGHYLANRKTVTSMKHLLDVLIEKNVNDSEENLRIVVSALNGLAGIYLLLYNPVQAVEKYRKVLQLTSRFNSEYSKNKLRVDKLQTIHTLHNLAAVLETSRLVQPTLLECTLREDCMREQEEHMKKYVNQNLAAYEETMAAFNSVETLKEKGTLIPEQWYSFLINWVITQDLTMELYSRIRSLLENATNKKKYQYITNEKEMLHFVGTWERKINDLRLTTIDLLNKIYDYTTDDKNIIISAGLVQAAVDCHLRPQERNTEESKCLVCKVSVQMREYEAKLFDMTKTNNIEDISNKGSWKPTSEELIFKDTGSHEKKNLKYYREEEANIAALEKHLGTHRYLETLRCQQYANQSPDPCPICKEPLKGQLKVTACGHCYCLECMQLLLKNADSNHIHCSVCRQLQTTKDILHIQINETTSEYSNIKIKGNYSTKLDAIVKLIIKLKSEENDVKVLVFSSMPTVLTILKDALLTNGIAAEKVTSPQNSQYSLTNFKDKNKNVTALLLSIDLGAKGLNLTEATHVILVEPLLIPGDELQAIERVHRIGQTRPTTVHKFLIKNTVEESIHRAISGNAGNWDGDQVTLQQLKDLYTGSLDHPTDNFENESGVSQPNQLGVCKVNWFSRGALRPAKPPRPR
ncbi:hypothetical protein ILUMI_26652 [Ignelater luminosus]|uniref:E3 ubiquitin-protein ligase SHPRH n=1 Tax=Ignelater luminosus TaxID=2038154 RepID=A0A8K0C9E6_IGNLU|nr:hypothetical protein ILUMI_26652 [Ignelater luminosus]